MFQYVPERKRKDLQNHISQTKSNSDVFKAKTALEVCWQRGVRSQNFGILLIRKFQDLFRLFLNIIYLVS